MNIKNNLEINPEKLEQIERGLRIKHIREKELKMKKTRQTCSHYLQEGLELCQNEHLLPERRI